MSEAGPDGRSYERIRKEDLRRLAQVAAADREDFFRRRSDWAAQYQSRLIATALCQGAALHFVNGGAGVNDFDVYSFYARHLDRPWYALRNKTADFGDPRFGQSLDRPHFVGRRVDLMGRSLDVGLDLDPAAAIREWLGSGYPHSSAYYLSLKAVVLLTPEERIGEVVWPVQLGGDSRPVAPA
jgi:hypothetical protein